MKYQTQMSSASSLTADIKQVAKRLPRFFPLDAFVASNPLHGFECYPFAEAIDHARRLFGGAGHLSLDRYRAALNTGALSENYLKTAVHDALLPGELTLAGNPIDLESMVWELVRDGLDPTPVESTWMSAATNVLNSHATDGGTAAADGQWDPGAETLLNWLDRSFGLGLSELAAERVIALLQTCLLGNGSHLKRSQDSQTLWQAFRSEQEFDALTRTALHYGNCQLHELLPDNPALAVSNALDALRIAPGTRQQYIERQLFELKGWSAFVLWYQRQPAGQHVPADLMELLAIRLVIEQLLWIDLTRHLGLSPQREALLGAAPKPAPAAQPGFVSRLVGVARWLGLRAEELATAVSADEIDALRQAFDSYDESWIALRFLEASEVQFRSRLNAKLSVNQDGAETAAHHRRPDAQLVFCIDVRSEPLRSAIEAEGNDGVYYQTFGYAGFFGLPISYRAHDGTVTAQCPVLIQPSHVVQEQPAPHLDASERAKVERALQHAQFKDNAAKHARSHPLAALGAVDGFGVLSLLPLLRDAFGLRTPPQDKQTPVAPLLEHSDDTDLPALSVDEQVDIAHSLFALTGMCEPFARVIVLCGHGSSSDNNPYASALDCGACGGQHGAPNARALATILNSADVRTRLAERGISIPADTVFVGALHDTTTDEVTLFGRASLPNGHQGDIDKLVNALHRAARANRQRRAPRLGVKNAERDILRRASDSAEVRPEWALANNAAFIIAPRELTAGLDLEGRCFLHSYNWLDDHDGSALTTIMTAPMVVTQWINAQYYFSTVDNQAYGSGNKVTQNVMGCAVMQGDISDVQLGLPLQSVMDEHGDIAHEPLRLLVVIKAPSASVSKVLREHPAIRQLFDNEWLRLEVIDAPSGVLLHYQPGGVWSPDTEWRARPELAKAS